MSKTKTIADRDEHDTSKLPEELQHESILLHRDMSYSVYKTYQIVFARKSMPAEYKIPEGWRIQHARIEYHRTRDTLVGMIFGDSCICIVLSKTRAHDRDADYSGEADQ